MSSATFSQPSQQYSILNTIFCRREKKITNKEAFKNLIEELNALKKKGIEFVANGKKYLLRFQLILILGDNLELNQICGFVESFNANFFCRICRIPLNEARIMFQENVSFLRDLVNYAKDVDLNNVKDTGVEEECTFNSVEDFHIVTNRAIDFMHDILEGVCVYVLNVVIDHFINVKKYFSRDLLNNLFQDFSCYPSEDNKPAVYYPSEFGKSTSKKTGKEKFKVKTYASEMLFIIRYFGIIMGHLIAEDDLHWQLFKQLRQIVYILMSPSINEKTINDLRHLIEAHHALFLQLRNKLKPKFHILLYYPRLLLELGPCIFYWCLRYEAKHRELFQLADLKISS